eukprot:CAMPEP_0179898774 /NCGR_PEP_ID=MMETSP0982-20121206/37869_1 /TAXON_ID=483367 /ORGANISM="non described non described, Strain CCMP 2436" /LENGTH=46 /DNA_ID= /DNA_START= /DNA_END= /DNA_ORIENTATION=
MHGVLAAVLVLAAVAASKDGVLPGKDMPVVPSTFVLSLMDMPVVPS